MHRIAWTLGLSIVCLLGLVPAAGAASWSAQPMVTPQAPNGNLLSVSCTGTTACTAVGANVDPTGRLVTLAEQWTSASPSSWVTKTTPNVAGTNTNNQLDTVSCSAANACIAIGGTGAFEYSTQWTGTGTGTAWGAIKTITPPSGSYNVILNAVSCAASNACEAVGSYIDSASSKTLALFEFWNGTTWVKQGVATPQPTSTYVYLNGVSCKSTLCVAAGSWTDSTFHAHPLIERLSALSAAGVWKQQTTPQVTGATNSTLEQRVVRDHDLLRRCRQLQRHLFLRRVRRAWDHFEHHLDMGRSSGHRRLRSTLGFLHRSHGLYRHQRVLVPASFA